MPDAPSFGDTYPGQLARWGTTALAVGAGARLVKHLFDVARDKDIRTPVTGKRLRSNVTEIPVEVSPEEAEQLKARGVKVGAETTFAQEHPLFGGEFAQNMGLGAMATAALGAGWKGVDYLVDHQRKAKARAKLEAQRKRVEKLLDGDADPIDAKIAGVMRAGEDAFVKKAGLEDAVALPLNFVGPLGIPLGAAAVLGLASAYKKGKKTEDEEKLKALRDQYISTLEPEVPILAVKPVVKARQLAKAD